VFLLNRDPNSFAGAFAPRTARASPRWAGASSTAPRPPHGPRPRRQGPAPRVDLARHGKPLPAILGIGDSLLYFVDGDPTPRPPPATRPWASSPLDAPDRVADKGFTVIDHLTNNVYKGTMQHWADFYKSVFNFSEVRYFDIRGA
jgi:4-hydroxyphenylpyruvate dioxygenase